MSSPGVITVHNLTVEESHDYDMPPPDTKHYYHELEPGKLSAHFRFSIPMTRTLQV